MTSAVRTVIHRLLTLAEEGGYSERKDFLATEGLQFDPEDEDDLFSAIHYAAGKKFETAEEADEWLSYVVLQRNQDIECPSYAINGLRPLHCACKWGNIFGVEWLVSRGADVDEEDKNGRTSYSHACASSVDRMKKILLLENHGYSLIPNDMLWAAQSNVLSSEEAHEFFYHLVNEKGMSVNATGWTINNTPLHEACLHGSIFGVKWLVEHNASINSTNENGETPFMLACGSGTDQFSKIRYLDEKGADCLAKDHNGRTALFPTTWHSACEDHVKDVLRYLVIEKGVDINSVDKNGRTPLLDACSALDYSLVVIQHLIQLGADTSARDEDVARFNTIFQRAKVRPDSIKLCVIGSEMAGKTTFVNSLLQLDRPPPKDEDRTPGIEIHNREIPGVGKGTTWDFVPLIRLVVIFNLIGVSEKGSEVKFQLIEVAETLQKDFKDTFKISHVIEMDCSKSQSDRMKDCREKLKRVREEILESAEDVPQLCHTIEEYLCLPDEERMRPLRYFLKSEEFEKWVAKDIGLTLTGDETKVTVEYLDSSGIVVNLGHRICVQPLWLCRNVIGPLLAPSYFVFGIPREKIGKVSKEDIESALRAFENHLKEKGTPSPVVVSADEAIEILLYLELCIQLEDMPGMYQIPALLNDAIPADAWAEDSTMDVYRGQRYECIHSVDIISPSSFVSLQCRCSRMENVSHKAWKNGIKLVKIVRSKVIHCLIKMGTKKEHHCIDVILRWSSSDGCEAVAKEFFDELKSMIATVCDERSPGVILNWFYIDSSHLKQLEEDPAIYSSSVVDQKVRGNSLDDRVFSVRPEKDSIGCIRDLCIFGAEISSSSGPFPADDEPVSDKLIKACAAVEGTDLNDICLFFDINDDDLQDIREKSSGIVDRRFRVLSLWKKRAEAPAPPTVRVLLGLLRQMNIGQLIVEKKYQALFGRK
ncbi:death-associated protein kinase 1-like [Oscarella lobularis]|uniref:death-associated protein kinase 1-like n=1 Tax=Oscarella lobularis TaxID=121494 RepID=UPI003313A806